MAGLASELQTSATGLIRSRGSPRDLTLGSPTVSGELGLPSANRQLVSEAQTVDFMYEQKHPYGVRADPRVMLSQDAALWTRPP